MEQSNPIWQSRSQLLSYAAPLIIGMLTALILLFQAAPSASAQSGLPTIRWSCSSRTIYLGDMYSASTEWAAYPSHPSAPKQTINLSQIAPVMLGKCGTNFIENLGSNIWLIRSNIVVSPTAKLVISASEAAEVRLESIVVGTSKQYVKLVANGGQVLIQGVAPTQRLRVHAWNTAAGAVDTSVDKGRSYLAALNGARMDIINAEMSYLGWYDANPNFPSGIGKGEPSGLAWKRRATDSRPETGPTGSIIGSDIHHNYYGNYTWQAWNMVLNDNLVHDNWYYGFDPHDYSSNFVVENNLFYNNGKHGLIFSRGCVNNVVRNNKMYNNHGHGFMLDRGSNNNLVENNEMYGNFEDGIVLYESSNNTFVNNHVHNNLRHGVRINASYDSGDIFDALAIDNVFRNNQVVNNARYGFSIYERADRNRFVDNIITGNGEYGMSVLTGLNQISNNTVATNKREGVYIVGSAQVTPTTGVAPYTPPLSAPGRRNQVLTNTISSNLYNGLYLKTEAELTLIANNTIASNGKSGVYVTGSKAKFNRLTRNSITGNVGSGITLSSSANGSMPKPTISSASGGMVTGTARAGAMIEIFCDTNGEGAVYKATTNANSSGAWTAAATCSSAEGKMTATATDANGNSSAFSSAKTVTTLLSASSIAEEPEPIGDAGSAGIDEIDDTAALQAANAVEAAADMAIPDEDGSLSTLNEFVNDVIDGEVNPNLAAETAGNQAVGRQVFLPVAAK